MEKDVVCGMEVETKGAPKVRKPGQTYYFCSQTCKDAFARSPTQFVKPVSRNL
ncbi:MAG: YHS domain-containing protein [Candidatus Aenigmarchaeota archaeon]|nr:YHS domain-containing protein [Candidatus Aenigmarchaeota archaeon]